jgi:hypothetical protein
LTELLPPSFGVEAFNCESFNCCVSLLVQDRKTKEPANEPDRARCILDLPSTGGWLSLSVSKHALQQAFHQGVVDPDVLPACHLLKVQAQLIGLDKTQLVASISTPSEPRTVSP